MVYEHGRGKRGASWVISLMFPGEHIRKTGAERKRCVGKGMGERLKRTEIHELA